MKEIEFIRFFIGANRWLILSLRALRVTVVEFAFRSFKNPLEDSSCRLRCWILTPAAPAFLNGRERIIRELVGAHFQNLDVLER
jgi:hypothetical protein